MDPQKHSIHISLYNCIRIKYVVCCHLGLCFCMTIHALILLDPLLLYKEMLMECLQPSIPQAQISYQITTTGSFHLKQWLEYQLLTTWWQEWQISWCYWQQIFDTGLKRLVQQYREWRKSMVTVWKRMCKCVYVDTCRHN